MFHIWFIIRGVNVSYLIYSFLYYPFTTILVFKINNDRIYSPAVAWQVKYLMFTFFHGHIIFVKLSYWNSYVEFCCSSQIFGIDQSSPRALVKSTKSCTNMFGQSKDKSLWNREWKAKEVLFMLYWKEVKILTACFHKQTR